MTTADIALLISGISALIAVFSLGWNVYRDVIIKPKVNVALQICDIVTIGEPSEDRNTRVTITATNHGPGTVILHGITAKNRKLFKKQKHFILIPDHADPLNLPFPRKLEVGENGVFYFPFKEKSFLKEPFTHLGVYDSFSRYHWTSKKKINMTKATYKKHFGKDKK